MEFMLSYVRVTHIVQRTYIELINNNILQIENNYLYHYSVNSQ